MHLCALCIVESDVRCLLIQLKSVKLRSIPRLGEPQTSVTIDILISGIYLTVYCYCSYVNKPRSLTNPNKLKVVFE